jgi:hypothetical protein
MREKWKKLKFLHLGVRVQLTERKEERNQILLPYLCFLLAQDEN